MKPIAAGLLIFLLCGCSTFKTDWRAAMASSPQQGVEGAWMGEWRSDKNGHHGSLKCVLKQETATLYRAHFRAKYFKILQYTYEATLGGFQTNGTVTLRGEADLGKLAGGVYRYDGAVTSNEFKLRYESKYDHGKFELKKAEPEPIMLKGR